MVRKTLRTLIFLAILHIAVHHDFLHGLLYGLLSVLLYNLLYRVHQTFHLLLNLNVYHALYPAFYKYIFDASTWQKASLPDRAKGFAASPGLVCFAANHGQRA